MINFVKPPDLLIYLRADIPKLVRQIQKRGRDFEYANDPAYWVRPTPEELSSSRGFWETLAAFFARNNHPVIAIDTDPSPNLAMTLGISSEDAARIIPIAENEQLIKLKTGTEFSGVFRLTFSVDDIIEKYSVPTPAGPALMVMGTVRSMGAGCTCPASHALPRWRSAVTLAFAKRHRRIPALLWDKTARRVAFRRRYQRRRGAIAG